MTDPKASNPQASEVNDAPATPPPAAPPRAVPAFHSPAAWLTLLLVLSLGMAIDIGTKYWSFETVAGQPVQLDRAWLLEDESRNPIPYHQGIRVLPWRLLDFRLVINRGAVFGIGANQRVFFIAFTFVALAVGLYVFGRHTTSRSRMAHVALGLILAGGIGNLYDRIVYGVVRDFLHMLPGRHLPFNWKWPGSGNPEMFPWVFNVADVMLLTGMVLLMIHINRVEKRRAIEARQRPESR